MSIPNALTACVTYWISFVSSGSATVRIGANAAASDPFSWLQAVMNPEIDLLSAAFF